MQTNSVAGEPLASTLMSALFRSRKACGIWPTLSVSWAKRHFDLRFVGPVTAEATAFVKKLVRICRIRPKAAADELAQVLRCGQMFSCFQRLKMDSQEFWGKRTLQRTAHFNHNERRWT